MTARQYYSVSNAGPVNNTSNATWVDVVQLPDFEPDASSTYALFWSSALQNATNTSADAQLRVRFGPAGFETTIATLNLESANTTEYPQLAGMFFHVEGSTPIDVYAEVQFKAETNTNSINAKNGQIVALKLGANDVAAESLTRQSTTSTTPASAVTANFTSDGGDYVVVGYGEFDCTIASAPAYYRLTCDGTNTAELGVRTNDATNLSPGMMVWRFTSVAAGSRTAAFQFRAHTSATAGITNARVLVMRAADFDAVYGAQLTSDSASTSSDAVAITFTETLTANPHLLLGGWGTSSTTTSTLITSQVTEAGSDIAESVRRTYNAAQIRFHASGFASLRTPGSGSKTYTLDRVQSGSANIAVGAGSGLALIDLGSGSTGITGSASGTLPLSGAATGTLRVAATASGSLPLTGSTAGTVRTAGAASGTLPLTGSAAGTVGSAISGSAAGTLPLTGSATSKASISATASGTLPLTGSSSATARIAGNASGTLPLTGSATGTGRIAASAAGSFALAGSAAATVHITGAGSLPLTGNAAGTALTGVVGSAAGTLPLTGGASGALRIVAAASGTLPLSGSAIGTARIAALAVGTFDLTGSSTASSAISGQASGLLDLTGESFGTTAIFGQASGDLPLTGEATGTGSTPAPIPAARIITPLAQRTVLTLEAIDRFIQPAALQTMLTPDARSVIVTPPQRCCTIILAGYEETDMSSEYFQWPDKLAPAVIFYGVDWARRLGEATIVSHDFELVSGSVTLTPRSASGTETSVSITGGAAGSVAVIIASAVASDGEVHAIRVSIDIT